VPNFVSSKADDSVPRRRPWLTVPWGFIVIVIVLVMAAPWLSPQSLAVVCAVIGGTLPVLLTHRRCVPRQ
jgi:hypothetical protein